MNQALNLIPTDEVMPPAQAQRRLQHQPRRNRGIAIICRPTWLSNLTLLALLSTVLTLPAFFLYAGHALTNAGANLSQARIITVFLTTGLASHEHKALADSLHARSDIVSAKLIDPTTMATLLPDEQLAMVELTPKPSLDTDRIAAIASELQTLGGVELVVADTAHTTSHTAAASRAETMARTAIAVSLVLAAVFIGLMFWRDLSRQDQHRQLMSQLGATQSMIRRPMLLRGGVLGLIAPAIALIAAYLLLQSLPTLLDLSIFATVMPDILSAGSQALFLLVTMITTLFVILRNNI